MKLMLCKSVSHLGIVGDVVEVSTGYARNYLLPQRLAVAPTEANVRALKEARRLAEEERAKERVLLESLAKQLKDVEITIQARANDSGVLYGSVGKKEISHALGLEGHFVAPEQVNLSHPIRQLDNLEVELRLADDLRTSIKLWVVREKTGEEISEEEQTEETTTGRTEAAPDGDDSGQ